MLYEISCHFKKIQNELLTVFLKLKIVNYYNSQMYNLTKNFENSTVFDRLSRDIVTLTLITMEHKIVCRLKEKQFLKFFEYQIECGIGIAFV